MDEILPFYEMPGWVRHRYTNNNFEHIEDATKFVKGDDLSERKRKFDKITPEAEEGVLQGTVQALGSPTSDANGAPVRSHNGCACLEFDFRPNGPDGKEVKSSDQRSKKLWKDCTEHQTTPDAVYGLVNRETQSYWGGLSARSKERELKKRGHACPLGTRKSFARLGLRHGYPVHPAAPWDPFINHAILNADFYPKTPRELAVSKKLGGKFRIWFLDLFRKAGMHAQRSANHAHCWGSPASMEDMRRERKCLGQYSVGSMYASCFETGRGIVDASGEEVYGPSHLWDCHYYVVEHWMELFSAIARSDIGYLLSAPEMQDFIANLSEAERAFAVWLGWISPARMRFLLDRTYIGGVGCGRLYSRGSNATCVKECTRKMGAWSDASTINVNAKEGGSGVPGW